MNQTAQHTVLLVYAKNRNEILNPAGALGSFIRSVADNYINIGYQVYINEKIYSREIELNPSPNSKNRKSFRSLISKITPTYIKRWRKERLFFSENEFIFNSIVCNIKEPIDSIIEFYSFGSNVGAQLKMHFKARLVCVYDSPAIDEYAYLNNWKKPIFISKAIQHEKENLINSDTVVCYSEAVKLDIKKRIPEIKDDAFVIRVAINTNALQNILPRKEKPNNLYVVFVGSHMKWHRVDLLLKAFATIFFDGNKHLRLILTGDGETVPQSKLLAKNLQIHDYVEFKGFVSDKEFAEILRYSHIGIMPGSNWYGAPVKLIDYGLNALSVIAPNTPNISDSFSDKNNIDLFIQDDLKSLTDKLRAHVENDKLRIRLGTQLQSDLNKMYSLEKERQFWRNLALGHLSHTDINNHEEAKAPLNN